MCVCLSRKIITFQLSAGGAKLDVCLALPAVGRLWPSVNDEDDDKSYDLWEDDYLGQCWPAGPWAVRGGIGIFWAALDPDPHIMTFCLQET